MNQATGEPSIVAVEMGFPATRVRQDEAMATFAAQCIPEGRSADRLMGKLSQTSGVQFRHTALPLDRYSDVTDFTSANDAYIELATELSAEVLKRALEKARVRPSEVDLVMTVSTTGLSNPSLEARLAPLVGLREDVKRLPVFALACLAGAAGIARVHDYLRAYPEQVAVLVAVELCTLTGQRGDTSAAQLVSSAIFGDGSGVVVMVGAHHPLASRGHHVVATRSRLYADTLSLMGWRIGSFGLKMVLEPEVPAFIQAHLGHEVTLFLKQQGLSTSDINAWICHNGGPKIIDAIQATLGLPGEVLSRTRESLSDHGNMSSVTVLDVLYRTMTAEQPVPAGAPALILALGPGLGSELVLLRW